MGRQDEIIQERLKKVKELRQAGVDPYPHKYDVKHTLGQLQEEYKSLKAEASTKDKVKIAGRIMTRRDMGKIAFGTVVDSSGKIQVVLQDGDTSKELFELFSKFIDSGDFIGVEGTIFRTKRGELSVLVKKMEILSKSMMPLPDKFHGLEDKEERYRKRYLDLLMNPEVRQVFLKREKMIDAVREFLKARNFNEVDTPYLQTIYGGASARPFKTHLNALDIPLFLAIAPELHLKRLIVGGFDRVFTIARNFRNEGIDRWHNPEFSMMEIYQAYADYNDMMELTEKLFEYVAKKANGTTKVKIRDTEVDFKAPWERMTMLQAIKKWAKIDANKMSVEELDDFMIENKVENKGSSWGMRVQSIFEHFCEEKIIQPTFIIDHPIETTPLCKPHRSGDKRLIERFEAFCMGAELANAYSELNDPILQRQLLEEQQSMLASGDEEAHPLDEDFLNAIEIGLPPTGGLGIGIDRMIILLTGQESIRDIILFPFMKPEKAATRPAAVTTSNAPSHSSVDHANQEALTISRADSLELLRKSVKSESLINHCLAVEASVRAYAHKYGANVDAWGTAGLLHDFDYEEFPEKHPLPGVEILKSKNYPKFVIQAILAHAPERTNVKRQSLLDKVLFAVDELSGFVVALSKVRPNGFEGMTADSVEKALKKKEFAKNVSRKDIEEGIVELGVDRKEHFELVIAALAKAFPKK